MMSGTEIKAAEKVTGTKKPRTSRGFPEAILSLN